MSQPHSNPLAAVKKRKTSARTAISLSASRRMLPLVGGILQDVQNRWRRLGELEAEQLDLDRRRRVLAWKERARRYQVAEDILAEQQGLQEASAELEHLAVVLVDPIQGEAAFPALINGRKAFFVWKLGDQDLSWWCYENDPTRRTIPENWQKES
jgi:hypothetical protein